MTWSRSSWFGSLFGVSCWLLPFGIFAAKIEPAVGVTCGVACALTVTTGVVLWQRRDQVSAHRAIQVLLAITAVVNTTVLLLARRSDALLAALPAGFDATGLHVGTILVAPTLMLFFWLRELSAEEGR